MIIKTKHKCDKCGDAILESDKGKAMVFFFTDESQISEMVICHKGKCDPKHTDKRWSLSSCRDIYPGVILDLYCEYGMSRQMFVKNYTNWSR